MIAQRICENTIFWLKQRFLSISKLLSRLRTGKWSETIYCSQRTQRLYLDWCLFFTLKYFWGTASCVCVVFVFVFVKDRKVVADNLSLAKKTRTVSRAKSAIATTNSWPGLGGGKQQQKLGNWHLQCTMYNLQCQLLRFFYTGVWTKVGHYLVKGKISNWGRRQNVRKYINLIMRFPFEKKVSTDFCGKIN